MPETQLKLFKEELDESYAPTPIVLRSIRLPPYTWPIGNNIDGILTELGYDVSEKGHRNNTNKRFIARKTGPGSYQWGSRALYVNYSSRAEGVGLLLLSSEKRKDEALQIAEKLEKRVTEDVKKYLEELKDEDFTRRAKEEIPTLQ